MPPGRAEQSICHRRSHVNQQKVTISKPFNRPKHRTAVLKYYAPDLPETVAKVGGSEYTRTDKRRFVCQTRTNGY